MAGGFFEFHKKLISRFDGLMGFSLGYGKYQLTSTFNYYYVTVVSGSTGAVFFEPQLGVRYRVTRRIHIKCLFSTFLDFGRDWDMKGTNLEEPVLPRGFILSFGFGMRFY